MSKYINDRLSWELLIKRLNKIAGEKTYTIDYAYGNNLKIPYVWENHRGYYSLIDVLNISRGTVTIKQKREFIKEFCSKLTSQYEKFDPKLVVKTDFSWVADRG